MFSSNSCIVRRTEFVGRSCVMVLDYLRSYVMLELLQCGPLLDNKILHTWIKYV